MALKSPHLTSSPNWWYSDPNGHVCVFSSGSGSGCGNGTEISGVPEGDLSMFLLPERDLGYAVHGLWLRGWGWRRDFKGMIWEGQGICGRWKGQ